jgi:hypothetical protein
VGRGAVSIGKKKSWRKGKKARAGGNDNEPATQIPLTLCGAISARYMGETTCRKGKGVRELVRILDEKEEKDEQ